MACTEQTKSEIEQKLVPVLDCSDRGGQHATRRRRPTGGTSTTRIGAGDHGLADKACVAVGVEEDGARKVNKGLATMELRSSVPCRIDLAELLLNKVADVGSVARQGMYTLKSTLWPLYG